MLTQEEINEALELEKKAELEAQSDPLDFLENLKNEKFQEKKQAVEKQSESKQEVNKQVVNKQTVNKQVKKRELEEIDVNKILPEEEEENNLKIEFQDEEDEENNEEEQESDEVAVAKWLNEKLDLNFDINEEALSNLEPEEILDNIIDGIKEKALEEYSEEIKEKVYKTNESYLLDMFLSNGGSIDDFIEYYNSQKQNIQGFDDILEEIKSYSPEQVLYVSLLDDGFSEEEALDYIDKLSKKGALEDEYEKELKKIERVINKNKSEYIKQNLQTIAEKQKEERIREYEEIENSKTEIADYLSKIDNIAGFVLDDNKKERLFSFLTEQDEEGYTAYDRYLQSNDNLLFQAIFAMFGSDILRTVETNGNERGKKNFFSKLPSSPAIPSKKQNVQQVNFEKLNEF